MKRQLFLFSIFIVSFARADVVAIRWETDYDDIFVWEIFLDDKPFTGFAGSSRGAAFDVESGYHCFKMRGHSLRSAPTVFSNTICEQTNPDPDEMIFIDLDITGRYDSQQNADSLPDCPDNDPLGILPGAIKCSPKFAEGTDPQDPANIR